MGKPGCFPNHLPVSVHVPRIGRQGGDALILHRKYLAIPALSKNKIKEKGAVFLEPRLLMVFLGKERG